MLTFVFQVTILVNLHQFYNFYVGTKKCAFGLTVVNLMSTYVEYSCNKKKRNSNSTVLMKNIVTN